jgi:hypothetical protein
MQLTQNVTCVVGKNVAYLLEYNETHKSEKDATLLNTIS